jgi:hypothetical protein
MADMTKPAWELEQEARAINAEPWGANAGHGEEALQPVLLLVRRAGGRGRDDSVLSGLHWPRQPIGAQRRRRLSQCLRSSSASGICEASASRRPIIPPGAVYIVRRNTRYGLLASKWANPFKPRDGSNRDEVIAQYRAWVCHQPELMARLPELRGRDLVCWCAPLPCHGEVLLELANSA